MAYKLSEVSNNQYIGNPVRYVNGQTSLANRWNTSKNGLKTALEDWENQIIHFIYMKYGRIFEYKPTNDLDNPWYVEGEIQDITKIEYEASSTIFKRSATYYK